MTDVVSGTEGAAYQIAKGQYCCATDGTTKNPKRDRENQSNDVFHNSSEGL
jgi:hypothetical protein